MLIFSKSSLSLSLSLSLTHYIYIFSLSLSLSIYIYIYICVCVCVCVIKNNLNLKDIVLYTQECREILRYFNFKIKHDRQYSIYIQMSLKPIEFNIYFLIQYLSYMAIYQVISFNRSACYRSRRHRLLLYRGVRLPQRVSRIWHHTI